MSGKYVVAVYMIDRSFGGHEEGGWWYNTGDLVRLMRVFNNEATAIKYSRALQSRLDGTLNKGRRAISSVLSTGRYSAEVWDDNAPSHYPEFRPHYE